MIARKKIDVAQNTDIYRSVVITGMKMQVAYKAGIVE